MSIQMLFLGLLVFVAGYVIAAWLIKKVPSMAEIADVLAIVVGVVAAFIFTGYFK